VDRASPARVAAAEPVAKRHTCRWPTRGAWTLGRARTPHPPNPHSQASWAAAAAAKSVGSGRVECGGVGVEKGMGCG
jgi:hypothetical protein